MNPSRHTVRSGRHAGLAGCWRKLAGVSFALLCLALLDLPAHAAAATGVSTNLFPALPSPLPDAGASVVRVMGALTLVLALFLGGVWVYKNWHRVAAQRGRPRQLELLESRSLGGRHALHVVGYQGQRLLLASSPNGISLVSHLPTDSTEVRASATPTSPENFVQVLQQAIQQKP